MTLPPISVRDASLGDLEAINAIYNHYVPISTTTYDYAPMGMDERRAWFTGRSAMHPATVAERGREIVGFGSLHAFRARIGYRWAVENSVYVHPDHQRTGVGSAILADLVDRARRHGVHTIVAGIDAEQAASVALHAKFGFVEVGRFPEVGRKFERWLDVIFMQLMLGSED